MLQTHSMRLRSSSRTASLYNQKINKLLKHIVDDYGILPGCCEIFLFVGVWRQFLRHLLLANCFSWISCHAFCSSVSVCSTMRNKQALLQQNGALCVRPVRWSLTGKTSRGDTTIWTRMSSVTAANLPASHSTRLGPNCQSSVIILVVFLGQLKIVLKIGPDGFLGLFFSVLYLQSLIIGIGVTHTRRKVYQNLEERNWPFDA